MSWLLWLIFGAVPLVGYFIYNGFCVRCPACGLFGLHPVNKKAEAAQEDSYRAMQSIGLGSALPEFSKKPGYSTRTFSCKNCSHHFDRATALIWLTTANRIGEDKALKGYKEVCEDSSSWAQHS